MREPGYVMKKGDQEMLKASEVIKHIEKMYDVKLLDYQKDFVKHVIRGDVIYTPRCFGRSMIYNGYADYLKNVVGKETNYLIDPNDFDKVYTYKDTLKDALCSSEYFEKAKNIDKKRFEKEYECKYGLNAET